LTVSFSDHSAGNIVSWEWDFDNDGTVDSYDQHPTWVFDEPGQWTVALSIADELTAETLIEEDYIGVFDGESAICFDGIESHASCASSPELNLREALTVEAWIHPVGWGEGTEGLRFGEIVDKNRFVVTLIGPHPSSTNYCLSCRIYQETGPTSFTNTLENSIILDGWQHVAVTYSPSTGISMYINGVLQELIQNVAPSHSIADNSAYDLYIGNSAVHSATFDGAIDEVRVWDIVRTGDQIRAGMADTLSGAEDGLVAYWRMNEGNGLTAEDLSGDGNHLSVGDIAWVAGTPFLPTSSFDKPVPLRFSLSQGSPNPFRTTTAIAYSLSEGAHVELSLYDISGREVRTLHRGMQQPGHYSVVWDGRSDDDQEVPSGVYFCRIEAGPISSTSRCVLMR
jgi:PKD repeat protein